MTQPSAFQLGMCDGACAMPNGSSTTSAPASAAVESTGPRTWPTRCWPYSADTPYESDASDTASTPAMPHQPPPGAAPVRTTTPTRPSPTPAARMPRGRSDGRQRTASSPAKIGTDAFATAARPESMCRSPHAISVNGIAELNSPSRYAPRGARRSSPRPPCAARNTISAAAATTTRISIIVEGSSSRPAILMKRYDEPQTSERVATSGTYARVTSSRYPDASLW